MADAFMPVVRARGDSNYAGVIPSADGVCRREESLRAIFLLNLRGALKLPCENHTWRQQAASN